MAAYGEYDAMKLRAGRLLRLVVMLPFILGCAKHSGPTYETIAEPKAAEEIQQRLLGQPRFNISKVYVARLTVDSNDAHITSLLPVFFRGYKAQARGFKLRDGYSFTVMAFNQARTGLELFTRDYTGGKAYHLVVPMASIESGVALEFPLVLERGALKQAQVVFRELRAK